MADHVFELNWVDLFRQKRVWLFFVGVGAFLFGLLLQLAERGPDASWHSKSSRNPSDRLPLEAIGVEFFRFRKKASARLCF